ncbi:MAG: bifunctional DNA primase/polymerase [Acidimicrobiales bacterium]
MSAKLAPNNESENKLVTDALSYAENGFEVFPLHAVKDGKCTCAKSDCTSPAKHPRTIRGLKQATNDLNLVKNLFGCFTYSSANIGVRTGKESNLVVIDVDEAKGGRIEELYEFVPREILDKTLWIKTGGGFHLYFSYPPNAEIRNSTSDLGNKIDVRGDGGYVVAPPSMHISGVRYKYVNQNRIQPLPPEIIQRIGQSRSKSETKEKLSQAQQDETIATGCRNESLTRIAGKLRHAGLSQTELETSLLKINSERCKPPLEAKEVLQIARSIARYDVGQKPQIDFESVKNTADFPSLLLTKTANVCIEEAKLAPTPKTLFDDFWFESEICILFADTGLGKSVLAVQVADSITKHLSIGHFALEAEKQKVLFFDCELSQKQFEKRYAVKENDILTDHYIFDDGFLRTVINRHAAMPNQFKTFEEYLNFSLEYEIVQTETRILIVDNITYLKSATETAKDALPLMKELNRLKDKYQLSIMALAHTPKRDMTRPISVNDLQGSKMLSNLTDSIFTIGQSAKDKNLRYLKQIKVRSEEQIYHEENVAVCQLIKNHNFLMFDFLTFDNEREHLKVLSDDDKADLIQKVKNLSASGDSQRKIAGELGISLGAVNKYLNK